MGRLSIPLTRKLLLTSRFMHVGWTVTPRSSKTLGATHGVLWCSWPNKLTNPTTLIVRPYPMRGKHLVQ